MKHPLLSLSVYHLKEEIAPCISDSEKYPQQVQSENLVLLETPVL